MINDEKVALLKKIRSLVLSKVVFGWDGYNHAIEDIIIEIDRMISLLNRGPNDLKKAAGLYHQ